MPSTTSEKVVLAWSSGKDSAYALHVLRSRDDVEVVGLLSTVNGTHDRVAMHGVRRELLRAQADAVGLRLHEVDLPWPCSNADYEAAMAAAVARERARGVTTFAFGDLFLEDIRRYREAQLAGAGMRALFPLWGRDTSALAREMTSSGVRAIITCVDPKQLDPAFAGRIYDDALLDALPASVDPCGERGELHTFVFEGPMLARPIPVRVGDIIERDGFVFADVMAEGE